jgi:beta-lactam-binding protein with PASTA domain
MPRLRKFISESSRNVRSLLSNKYFWGGLAGLLVVFLVIYILVDDLVMPGYTRHGVAVRVPDVLNQPFEQAKSELEAQELDVRKLVQRFNPNFPRDVVVDQNPPPNATVKPGRNVYLTINSGELQKVAVPAVGGLSLREAVNRLKARGLDVSETLPDSIPAPNPNTVTRQSPAPGDSLNVGASVKLWYSTGLGQEYVTIPDLLGLSLEAAQQTLLESQLRYIVIGADEDDDTSEAVVHRQSRDPGTRVPAGFEVRIYLDEEVPEVVEEE